MPPEQLLDPDAPAAPVGGGQVVGDQLRIGQRFQLHFLFKALHETSRRGETEQLSFSSGMAASAIRTTICAARTAVWMRTATLR